MRYVFVALVTLSISLSVLFVAELVVTAHALATVNSTVWVVRGDKIVTIWGMYGDAPVITMYRDRLHYTR